MLDLYYLQADNLIIYALFRTMIGGFHRTEFLRSTEYVFEPMTLFMNNKLKLLL